MWLNQKSLRSVFFSIYVSFVERGSDLVVDRSSKLASKQLVREVPAIQTRTAASIEINPAACVLLELALVHTWFGS